MSLLSLTRIFSLSDDAEEDEKSIDLDDRWPEASNGSVFGKEI